MGTVRYLSDSGYTIIGCLLIVVCLFTITSVIIDVLCMGLLKVNVIYV